MADKTVGMLENVPALQDDSLIPVEQGGELMNLSGKQIREFVSPYAERAEEAAATATGCETGAKEAWTGVQNAIKNIPSGSTPIVNDLTTGGATMALSAEMGKVLGRRPNPNLLDNAYFLDPINQRGQTQYNGGGYTIDRWKIITSATTVTCGSDGVSVYTATASLAVIRQDIELSNLDNRIVTLSMLLADGTLCTDSGNTNGITSGSTSVLALADGATSGRYAALFRDDTTKLFRVQLKAPTGVEMKVVAVKLELGDTQTLAHLDANGNWVLNELPDKQQELAKCQRYQYNPLSRASYQALCHFTAVSTTQAVGVLPLPVTMRHAGPTLAISDATALFLQSSSYTPLTALTLSNVSNGSAKLVATVAAGLVVGQSYVLSPQTNLPLFILDANM